MKMWCVPPTLPDCRRIEGGAGFYTQPERRGILSVTEKIFFFQPCCLCFIFGYFHRKSLVQFPPPFCEGLLVLMNRYLDMKWV